jgi:hypothetical protein
MAVDARGVLPWGLAKLLASVCAMDCDAGVTQNLPTLPELTSLTVASD